MSDRFVPVESLSGPGEAASNADLLTDLVTRAFPDAVDETGIDFEVLQALAGHEVVAGQEKFGLSWPGKAESRRLALLPPDGTLLPRPDESVDWDGTQNLVVEGDNLAVLRLLRRAYAGKVDVIYIDPPYNTAGDLVYDDKREQSASEFETASGDRDEVGRLVQVSETSGRKHSSWLSMMHPRLWAARDMLADDGVLIAAIDDNEQANLKLLLDQVFGAENFIATVVWQGGRKNDSRYISVGHDYMLIYAKNEQTLAAQGVRWREEKEGVDDVIAQGRRVWEQFGPDERAATSAMRAWFKSKRADDPVQAMSRYTYFLPDGALAGDTDLTWPGGKGPKYDVLHPDTGLPVPIPERGWLYAAPERMQQAIDAGEIIFRDDHTRPIRLKKRLEAVTGQVVMSVFERQRTHAGRRMKQLFGGDSPFTFPKDVDVLTRWIGLVSGEKPDALVLDFFAGSGSTGHAVLELNASDGGRRRYVLVQVDENIDRDDYESIADVTRERLRRAGRQIADERGSASGPIDLGFRSYRLAASNIQSWGGEVDGDVGQTLLDAVDNLVEGRTTDDLLVEMMLRLGVELTVPVEQREVAGSTLYSVGGGTLFAHFGTDITVQRAKEIARAIQAWRDEDAPESDVSVVVRDTGFADSSAKLNLAAALNQVGITTLRSV
ncbi:site-specific DNA-methyltransferase [Agrococcus sp. ARC_14]|uniref:site-specific DNA-methyltransferase n=1 Tax=Agrococcus sp. ARC_14 TaxID=2919927 RepID=UPI001F05ABA1|nr:site-specific DNA-methyltransferase [Agrococcus sp. ARC_14]MCH1883953.1 site-specific DNA-methyltransferase [Agrococcus sp. ARC_14]